MLMSNDYCRGKPIKAQAAGDIIESNGSKLQPLRNRKRLVSSSFPYRVFGKCLGAYKAPAIRTNFGDYDGDGDGGNHSGPFIPWPGAAQRIHSRRVRGGLHRNVLGLSLRGAVFLSLRNVRDASVFHALAVFSHQGQD